MIQNCDSVVDLEEMEFILLGFDAIALFPSLKEKRTGLIARIMVEKSDVIIEGLNYKQMALYVKLNPHLTGDLGTLKRLLPWRNKSRGVAPGMQNPGVKGREIGGDDCWSWHKAEPTQKEKKMLEARVAEI